MRTFDKPNYDWLMNFTELRDMCEEVYGVPYDIQMGERSNGEYDIVTTGEIPDRQGYWTGLGQGYGYEGKYIEGHKFVHFVDGECSKSEDILRESLMAIEKWQSQSKMEKPWGNAFDRPFDKVGDNGEYTFYQPDLQVVMNDLVAREEIPPGTYMITIDW